MQEGLKSIRGLVRNLTVSDRGEWRIFISVFLSDTSRPRSENEVELKDPEDMSPVMP